MDRGARPRTDASEGKSRDGGRTGTPGTLYMNRLAEGMKVSNSESLESYTGGRSGERLKRGTHELAVAKGLQLERPLGSKAGR